MFTMGYGRALVKHAERIASTARYANSRTVSRFGGGRRLDVNGGTRSRRRGTPGAVKRHARVVPISAPLFPADAARGKRGLELGGRRGAAGAVSASRHRQALGAGVTCALRGYQFAPLTPSAVARDASRSNVSVRRRVWRERYHLSPSQAGRRRFESGRPLFSSLDNLLS
jgi:hypothetical protein